MTYKKTFTIALAIIVGITTVVPAGLVIAQEVPVSDRSTHQKQDETKDKIDRTNAIAKDVSNVLGTAVPFGGSDNTITLVRGKVVDEKCRTIINALAKDGIDQYIKSLSSPTNFSFISGGNNENADIKKQIASLEEDTIPCVVSYIELLTSEGSKELRTASVLSREQDTFTALLTELKERLTQLKARASATWKDILKAAATKLLISQTQRLSTDLINKMTEKYKITDYLAYGDAIASQVYNQKYINENFSGDARQQMMIRSILQSEKLPQKIVTAQSFATEKAQEYLGKACNVGNTSSQTGNDYIKCLAAYGSREANPAFHFDEAVDQAAATDQAGKQMANQEISQSKGYAPSRNCEGVVGQQTQIDSAYEKAATESRIAIATYNRLENALKNKQTTQGELDQAATARDQAQANLKALKEQVSSPILDICKGIDSPAEFVAGSIKTFLEKHLQQATDLKSDNLGFSLDFLTNIADNFITNLLTGGKSTSQVLKEAGLAGLNGGLVAVTQGLGQPPATPSTPPIVPSGTTGGNTPPGTVPDISVYASPTNAPTTRVTTLIPGQNYIVTIDFASISSLLPIRIEVSGTGIAGINRSLTAAEITAKKITFSQTAPSGPLTMTISLYKAFENNSTLLIERYTKTLGSGQVSGANIILPRGPSLSVR